MALPVQTPIAIRMARARKAEIDVLAIDGRFKNVLVVSWSTGAAAMTRFVLGLEGLAPSSNGDHRPDGVGEFLVGLQTPRGLDAALGIATWWHLLGSLSAIWPDRFVEAAALAARVTPSHGPVEDRIHRLESPPTVADAYRYAYEAATELEPVDPPAEVAAIWEDCLLAAQRRAIEGNRGMYMPGAGRVNPPLPGDPPVAGDPPAAGGPTAADAPALTVIPPSSAVPLLTVIAPVSDDPPA